MNQGATIRARGMPLLTKTEHTSFIFSSASSTKTVYSRAVSLTRYYTGEGRGTSLIYHESQKTVIIVFREQYFTNVTHHPKHVLLRHECQ